MEWFDWISTDFASKYNSGQKKSFSSNQDQINQTLFATGL